MPEPERRFSQRGPSRILTSGCSDRALSSATPTARHWGTSNSRGLALGSAAKLLTRDGARRTARKPAPPLVRKRHTFMKSNGGDRRYINLASRCGSDLAGNTETHKQG